MSKKSKRPVKAPTLTATKPTTPPVELAGMGARLAAVIYDGLLIVALNAIVATILIVIATPHDIAVQNQTQVLPEWFRSLVLFPAMMTMTWLFYGYFWRKTGQTLGMQTWRLKVIKPDGVFLPWGDSAGRCAAALVFPIFCGLVAKFLGHGAGVFALSVIFGFIANYLWAWVNGRGLAWHDQLSATVVIRVAVDPRQKRGIFGWFSQNDD